VRKRRFFGLLSGVLAAGALLAATTPDARMAQVENGLRPPVLIEGDKTWTIEERLKHYGVEGVSIAVIRDSKLEWAKGYGVADVETKQAVTASTLFQAASISKPVAAMGALVLVQDGRLSLDEDINKYLKGWKVPANEFTAKTPVTLEELLSHTAGLTVHGFPGYASGSTVPTVQQVLDGAAPANTGAVRVNLAPGAQFRYSGGGYTVVQVAMTDVTGQTFPALMQKLVLAPLGMKESTFEQPLPAPRLAEAAVGYRSDGKPVGGKRHVYPEMAAAGLWTTPSDLARFAIGLQKMLHGGKGPLSQKMAENMITPRREGYGLGLGIEEEGRTRYFTHGGSNEGFRALLLASENRGYGAVVMTNSDDGAPLLQEIIRAVAAAYYWEGYQIDPVMPAKLTAEQLGVYAGRYRLDADTIYIVEPAAAGGGLQVRVPLEETFTLVPVSQAGYVRRDNETRYTFGRRPDGGAQLIVLKKGSEPKTAPRVDKSTHVPAEDLEAGRLDEAVAGYKKLQTANASDPSIAESRFNELGYEYLRKKDYAKAIAIFRLNTELYPDSANPYDSLGEALEASGDKAGAIAMYAKCVEVASRPGAKGVGQNDSARAHSAERLKALGGGAS
jgi:CubicO group peptidase (beta-lactamase class C family)